MAKKKATETESAFAELEAAKREAMRIRFRTILGEKVAAHVMQAMRKKVAKCVISLKKDKNSETMRRKNA